MNSDTALRFISTDQPSVELLQGTQVAIQQIQDSFEGAEWVFQSDGSFMFRPQQSVLPENFFPVTGTFVRSDNHLQFQGERRLNLEEASRISIDGIVDLRSDRPVIQCICTLSWQSNSRQIASVSQAVDPAPELPTQRSKPLQSPTSNPPDETFSNSTELDGLNLEDIPSVSLTLRHYQGLLSGETEAGTFAQLPIQIFIDIDPNTNLPSSFSFVTAPQNPVQHGAIQWNFQPKEDTTFPYQLIGSSEQFHLEGCFPEGTFEVSWFTLPQEVNATASNAITESIKMTVSLEGDRITGEIEGTGFFSPASSSQICPTTYHGIFAGELAQSRLVRQLRRILETVLFSGNWQGQAGAWQQITLNQENQTVTGHYLDAELDRTGMIRGTCQGDCLSFVWEMEAQQGHGFLRAIAKGSTLAGFFYDRTQGQLHPVIAAWKLPGWLETTVLEWQDIQDLRSLGHDLVVEHRSEQAVAVLDLALHHYKLKRDNPETSSSDQTNCLASEAFTLAGFLPACNFQLGWYEKLLENLVYMLEVLRLLGPEISASRLFRERTESLTKTLRSNRQTLLLFRDGYTQMLNHLDKPPERGVVGIFLERDEQNGHLIVTQTAPGKPAIKEGIQVGDRLVEIDGHYIQGLNVEQAIDRLKGAPGTPVVCTIARDTHTLSFSLIRQQELLYPSNQKTHLQSIVSALLVAIESLDADVSKYLAQLEEAIHQISQGQDPVEAWILLANDVQRQIRTVVATRVHFLSFMSKIYGGHPTLQQDVEALLRFVMRPLTAWKEQQDLRSGVLIEQRVDAYLDTNSDITPLEKSLFQSYMQAVSVFSTFAADLDGFLWSLNSIDARQLFEDNRQRSLDMSSRLPDQLERWRSQIMNDLDKIDALEKGQPFYHQLIAFLIEQGDIQGALVAAEKSRARALSDLLSQQSDTGTASDATDQARVAESPTLEQIQHIAQTCNTHIVEYFIRKEGDREVSLLIWVIAPSGTVQFRMIPLDASVTELVQQARQILGTQAPPKSSVPDLFLSKSSSNPLHTLHRLLIQSIQQFLPNRPQDPIIFVPHSALFLLPFSALKNESDMFLINSYTVVVLPAIQVLRWLRSPNSITGGTALIVGNPLIPEVPGQAQQQKQSGLKLGPLEAAEIEAQKVAALLHTHPLIGAQATKAEVVHRMMSANLIHLATHGLLDETEMKMPGAIVLSPSRPDMDDNLLMTGEIIQLKLNADLVVLSACHSGEGQITGDGVIGLSRSLLAAGSACIVVSLWQVADLSTAFLMIQFYQFLLQGITPIIALHKSQKWLNTVTKSELQMWIRENVPMPSPTFNLYIKRFFHHKTDTDPVYDHPYYWAPFCIIGQP